MPWPTVSLPQSRQDGEFTHLLDKNKKERRKESDAIDKREHICRLIDVFHGDKHCMDHIWVK